MSSSPSSDLARAPAVTAIVSTYKSARFMAGCLEDLVGQTLFAHGELEIVVIDSGSPENEGDIVRAFQARYPGIRYLRTEREGLYAAWNRGVGLATGRYLTSANTDDRHRGDALEILAAFLDAHPAVALAYADCLITARENETFASTASTDRFDWPPYRYSTLQDRCIVGPQPVWRRELHARYGLFDENFQAAGDYEFWLRMGRHETFAKVPEVLGLYLQNSAGLEYASGRTERETLEIRQRYAPAFALVECVVPPGGEAPGRAYVGPDPEVSVIVPTFNRPKFLIRALESLCRQSLREIEAVVVNDAGEPLDELLAGFSGRLAITSLRHETNRDRAAARNSGLAVARGRYIAYLDDDDCFRPDHLAVLCETLERRGAQVAYGGAAWLLEEASSEGPRTLRPLFERSRPFDREALLVENTIAMPAVVHARACLAEVGGFDESLGTHEDWDFLIRLAARYPFQRVQQATVEISWRQDGSSTTSDKPSDFLRTMEVIHARYHALGHPGIWARQEGARRRLGASSGPEALLPEVAASRAAAILGAVKPLLAAGKPKEALALLAGALDLAPQAPEILLALIDVFAADNQPAAAEDALAQAAVLFPRHPEVRRRLELRP